MKSIHLSQFKHIDMKLTQEIIDKIQKAFEHTKMNGDLNWEDGDEIDVNLAGTFAADRFITIINRTKSSTSIHNVKGK
tara:strand:+ start:488 stop:721 length:234 start_codon:yes stop_codon:yes gene_type:complete